MPGELRSLRQRLELEQAPRDHEEELVEAVNGGRTLRRLSEEDHAVADAAGEPAVLADAEGSEDADSVVAPELVGGQLERRERVQVDVLVDEGDVVVARPGRTVIERRSRGRE